MFCFVMPTKLIRGLYNVTQKQQGCVMTIGNFDGVHLGHQQLIASVVAKARALLVPSLVLTFEPHPFEFLSRNNPAHPVAPRLTRLREKFLALANCGVDNVLVLSFNQKLATKTASDFVTQILSGVLHAQQIIIGDDFRFGHQRQGNIELLHTMGKSLGFNVETVAAVSINNDSANSERISSTRIREALRVGDHELVKKLLGHAYSLMGRVRFGDQRGRQLGFPTANIYLHRQLTPIKGVYTVLVHGVAEKPWPGVANIGVRPTVDGTRCLLEVHLLGFDQDIYGRYVQVEFCTKLRDEMRYPNLILLKEQITKDVATAKNYFAQ